MIPIVVIIYSFNISILPQKVCNKILAGECINKRNLLEIKVYLFHFIDFHFDDFLLCRVLLFGCILDIREAIYRLF